MPYVNMTNSDAKLAYRSTVSGFQLSPTVANSCHLVHQKTKPLITDTPGILLRTNGVICGKETRKEGDMIVQTDLNSIYQPTDVCRDRSIIGHEDNRTVMQECLVSIGKLSPMLTE